MRSSLNKICGIYKIISPTGKIYIGESDDINRRWDSYKKLWGANRQTKLINSFNKYKVENHIFEIIEECELSELKCKERYWQDFYDVLNGGLNCKLTQCGELKILHSEETRQKMSKSQIGELNHMYGKIGELNPNWKGGNKKFCKCGLKIKKHNKTCRDCMDIKGENSPLFGKKRSAEQKKKISLKRKENGIAKGGNNPRAKIVLCLQTGIFYDCAKDAAETYGINISYLRSMLNGNDKNKTSLIYC